MNLRRLLKLLLLLNAIFVDTKSPVIREELTTHCQLWKFFLSVCKTFEPPSGILRVFYDDVRLLVAKGTLRVWCEV